MPVALPCVAQFVIVLDVTIVAIALPVIQDDLGLSTTALGWVITIYTLLFGGCMIAAGRVADRHGRRRTFVAGLATFAVASAACGLAPTGAALLAARALQGLGAALVSPAALALVTDAKPNGPARARALGWWTAAAAGGGASGWVLGGVMSDALGWRSVFLVNVPVCLAAAALAPRVLRESRDRQAAPIGATAAALATGGLAAGLLALTLIERHGPLSVPTAASLAAAVILLAAFIHLERRSTHPLLDRRHLRRRGVRTPNAVAAVLTAATTPPMFLAILHAQHVLGLEPAEAGLLFPPFNLAVIAGSLLGPGIVARTGERAAMIGGLATVAAGALALHAVGPDVPPVPSLLGGFTLLGAGLGAASVASTMRGTAALEQQDQGLASGLLATSAQLGTALGLAIIVPLATTPGASLETGFTLAAALASGAALAVARSG
jgi:MFS family permease